MFCIMAPNQHPHVALTWAPSGKRKHGKPRETWRRTAEREHAQLGLTSWAAAVAKNRGKWRTLMSGPTPPPGGKELSKVLIFAREFLNICGMETLQALLSCGGRSN